MQDPFINVLVDELNKLKDNNTVEDIDEIDDYLNPKTISETNKNSSKHCTRNKWSGYLKYPMVWAMESKVNKQ